MVPANILPEPVSRPAYTITSAGPAVRILAGTPAPSTAAAPAVGPTWTQEV
ncbi:hypothetical protein GCM10009830_15690 [Glycomyces endophyticus]|uniref:Uncharacterized protein n=1 Tax=Glycomyces endophyticus TaxID=480996 RepID=A0ABP4SJ62_9ACTN